MGDYGCFNLPFERLVPDSNHLTIHIIFCGRYSHQINISDNYTALALLMIINN